MPGDPGRPPRRNDPAIEAAYEAAPDTLVAEILDGVLFKLAAGALRATVTLKGERPARVEPFDAIELDLALLFST